ncbi:MAG TPA: PAS domain S-box protein [Bacteroidota bacterium]
MEKEIRVLMLEDSEADAILEIREVTKAGVPFVWKRVDSRESFREALNGYRPDIILADFSLPGFDGRTALFELRKTNSDIPFVFVTGTLGEELAIELLKEGATDYVPKERLARLASVVQRALREHEERQMRAKAEQAHEESLLRYRLVVENASDVIFTTDREGNFTYANHAGVKISGYSMGELWKSNYLDLIPIEHQRRVRLHYLRHVASRAQSSRIEFPFRAKDGSIVWFSQNASLILEQGEFRGFQVIAHDITERKIVEQKLKHLSEQLRALAGRLQSVREDEQTRIAREIHDELGQSLTGLKMDLVWVEKRIATKSQTPGVSEKIRSMFTLIDDTIRMVRRISAELRPGALDDLGLVAALEWQLNEFSERTGIKGTFQQESNAINLDRDRSTAVFRIFQESLTNVLRHSAATRVRVRLFQDAEHFKLEVHDNGRGITDEEIANVGSLGILGMRERALVFNGYVDFASRQGKGTTVKVTIPTVQRPAELP